MKRTNVNRDAAMFNINFDDLELSLDAMIQHIKRKDLLDQACLASSPNRAQTQLRAQLEDQASVLLRLKNHYSEIRQDSIWEELEKQAQRLLNIRTLFSTEQAEEYQLFKAKINWLITTRLNTLDRKKNEKLIQQAQKKANSNTQVKTYKNWTSI